MTKLLIALTLSTSTLCSLATAQPAPTLHSKIAGSSIIDGSKNPEKISDVVAFRLFLGRVGRPTPVSSATPVPTAKQKALLGKILELSDADTAVVLKTSQAWHDQADQNSKKGAAGQRLDQITTPLLARIQTQMSAAGWKTLWLHVQDEKRNMRIVTIPNAMQ